MQNDHNIQCNCFDCIQYTGNHNDFDPNDYINKFVRYNKTVNIYSEPGGGIRRTAKPNTYIGKIIAVNSKRNWLKLSNNDGWILYNKNYTFNTPEKIKDLTTSQKIDIALSTSKNIPGAELGATVLETGKQGADTVIDFLPNLKWYLIALLLVVLLAVFLKIKG